MGPAYIKYASADFTPIAATALQPAERSNSMLSKFLFAGWLTLDVGRHHVYCDVLDVCWLACAAKNVR